jgi:Mn2+/Fe2+ NRAMP family transporter
MPEPSPAPASAAASATSRTAGPASVTAGPPVPRTFRQYLASFGPGIMVVLTWLGAGDVIDMGMAGAHHGYSLMWVLVVAILMRFVFVSVIARYQLCNQHGEGVLDGLARLHPWFAPALLVAAVVMSHVYLSYMTVGTAEVCRNLLNACLPAEHKQTAIWPWALFWNGVALWLVFRPSYDLLESIFKVFLALLSVSFVGSAIWVGFDPDDLAAGLFRMEMPAQTKTFNATLIAAAMIGAVGGSLMNLAYPYFLEAKGWRGPQYRRVQFYDFLLGIIVMIVLNLAVWILGAQLLYPDGEIKNLEDMPQLLSLVLGPAGLWLFYLGIFAALYTSVLGHALGLGYMGAHAWLRYQAGTAPITQDFRKHPLYRAIAVWCLVSSLIWTIPGAPGFITLTLVTNAAQVVMVPFLAGGLWWISADSRFIGAEYRNRWWENLVIALLFVVAIYSTYGSVQSIIATVKQLI